MSTIGDQLAAEWHDDETRIRDWFHRHEHHHHPQHRRGDNITTSETPACPAQGDNMSVPDAVAALKTNLESAAAALTTALTDDVPGLENIGTQIDNSRLIQAAVAADSVVPQAVLDAEAATLEALAGAFAPGAVPMPVPAPVAADPAPAEPVAADPTADQSAA